MYAVTPNVHLPNREIDEDFNRRLEEVLSDGLMAKVPALPVYIEYWVRRKEVENIFLGFRHYIIIISIIYLFNFSTK